VGKLVLAFTFYICSAALAVHEARPPNVVPPPLRQKVADRVNVAETADPIRSTPPFVMRPIAPRIVSPPPAPIAPPFVPAPPPPIKEPAEVESGDVPDVQDKCPEVANGERDDDGCPEVTRTRTRTIVIEMSDIQMLPARDSVDDLE
jgi:hypothetical protein